MTGAYQLAAARGRATATMSAHRPTRLPPMIGVLVLDAEGQPTRIVGPFASGTTARQWAAENRVTAYQLWPLEVPGRRS